MIKKSVNIILAVILPIATLCFTEYFTHVITDLTIPVFLTNLIFYYLLYLLCFFLTGRLKFGYSLATVLFFLFGLTNYCVLHFRSTPFVPWDIYSIRTAASVAGNYKLEAEPHLVGSCLGFLVLFLISTQLKGRISKNKYVRTAGCMLGLFLCVIYTKGVGSTPVINFVGLDTTLFTPKVLYRNNGLTTGFLSILKYVRVERPENYSVSHTEEVAAAYSADSSTQDDDYPNILVIMNEAFSDLSVYGDLETDQDYMPFIHSLSENAIKGECYVSVKGGSTANSEYEFLTGNSMAFVPSGSVPYQQYIKNETPSLASYLTGLDYQTVALHPYNASGWNRDKVYPLLGFSETYFKNDYTISLETLRGYVDDRTAFQMLIQLYEDKEPGKRLFAFEVTMQNHGGYSKEFEDLTESIHLTQLTEKSTQTRAAEKYLTLMSITDEAFGELIEYFSNVDEKTIILMFGDHQPSDYITNTFVRLFDLDKEAQSTLDLGYIVPYIIWANYDIDETASETISSNYLSTLLLSQTNLPLTGYLKYLTNLKEEYPVITATQMRDSDGNRLEKDTDLINDYACLSYNLLCDTKHKLWDFFYPK